MIHVVGVEGTQEYAAAMDLRNMISKAWPEVSESAADIVYLITGAQCHGQTAREIDLILLADFGPGRSYAPFLSVLADNEEHVKPNYVAVRTLCAVIEVKDLGPEAVRFVGTNAHVRYSDRWKSATDQNHKQLFSVQQYLRRNGIQPPWITPLVWLRNVPNVNLPRRPHNILGSQVTWELILNVIGQTTEARWINNTWTLDAASRHPFSITQAAELFTKVVEPTRLDRARMERINQRSADLAPALSALDKQLVIFRGRGGTGKTMRLLQLAKRLLDMNACRVLILTYNKALVADIRRLLTIIGIDEDITGGAIQIQTVHSFFHAAISALDLATEDYESFLPDYEHLKDEALAYLRSGAISAADLASQTSRKAEPFSWDYVFVDEGQDWPDNERDLLLQLYSYSKVVIADGIDQLVRTSKPTKWREAVSHRQSEIIPLNETLRMKSGLARFVSTVAAHLGFPSVHWEANEGLSGGRVIIVDGPYLYDRSLHDQLVKENSEDKNAPVDMLFCVPPALVIHGDGRQPPQSVASIVFNEWGFKTWDGASDVVRDSYPIDIDQLRIVQYESCRGLEGWTVVNLALDRFYEYKLEEASRMAAKEDGLDLPGVFSGDHSAAQRFAGRWILIPLTRAMSTLVIQLDGITSKLRTALLSAAAEHKEYVTWISTGK